MGLTLGCARCHDHKFDPISTEDYHGLAGIFKSTKTMEHFTKIARWNEVSLASADQQSHHDQAQAAIQKKEDQLKQLMNREAHLAKDDETGSAVDTTAAREAVRQQIDQLKHDIARQQAALIELPSAMAVTEYDHPVDLKIHIRGNHLTLGHVVARRVPAVLVSDDHPAPAMPTNQSGRLQLARWLVDGRHPLTARVLVNRVWRWHFGRGIVESTDNFGRLGDRPTNPELLDWLANELVRNRWSIKWLHRSIMLSGTYRLSSQPDESNLAIDPENHYQWRANVRRLEAEAIRDSILAVSGLLDNSVGGSLLHVKNREFLFDHTSKDDTRYDSQRRSVLLPVIRNHLYDMFQLFDYSDASVMTSNRSTTTVAPQALFLLNSELVQRAAQAFAARLRQLSEHPEQRIDAGYTLAFGRHPTRHELQRDLQYLIRLQEALAGGAGVLDDAERRGWELLCHTWLAANEFVYVQ
jgi:hypothetical protein